jgi:glycosyltransferase involved in cell wall biosynthesis
MKISIIVPTYNRKELSLACAGALCAQTYPRCSYEVIFIDDGSPDGTYEALESRYGDEGGFFRVLRQDNKGPAAARNYGVSVALGDIILFTDDDCLPAPNWVDKHLEWFDRHPDYAGAGGLIRRKRDSLIGRFIDVSESMMHPGKGEDAYYLITANAGYRKKAFEAVGGFDERITWPGGEDPDLSRKIVEWGGKLGRNFEAMIEHEHRDTLSGLHGTFVFHGKGLKAQEQIMKMNPKGVVRVFIESLRKGIRRLRGKRLPIPLLLLFGVLTLCKSTSFAWGYLCCPRIQEGREGEGGYFP